MALPKPFSKEVFIRLHGNDAFVSMVKYGCFYSTAREFKVDWEARVLDENAPLKAIHLVPPVTVAQERGA